MDTENSPRSVTSGISTSSFNTTPKSPTRSERKGKRMAPPPPPAHLSEFLSYVNGTGNNSNLEVEDKNKFDNKISNLNKQKGKKKRNDNQSSFSIHSNLSNQSISSITSMTPTTMDLDVLITKKDILESIEQMHELKLSCDNLTNKLKEVSEAFGDFGAIIEKISRSKGSGDYCNSLSTFSNYQYLISNQHRYLGELLYKDFSEKIDNINKDYEEKNQIRRTEFENQYKKLVKELKNSEVANSKLRKGKIRNLVSYKSNLVNLTNKLENIDHVYHDYYVDSFNLLEEANGQIVENAKNAIYHESIVFTKLSEKTQPGNGLDDLLIKEEEEGEEGNELVGDDYEEGNTTIQDESSRINDLVLNNEISNSNVNADKISIKEVDKEVNKEVNKKIEEEEEEDMSKRDERYMQNAVNMLHSAIDNSDNDN